MRLHFVIFSASLLFQPDDNSEAHIVFLTNLSNAEPGHLNQAQTEQFFSCSDSFKAAHKAYLQPISHLLRAADRETTPTNTPATTKGKRKRSSPPAFVPKRTMPARGKNPKRRLSRITLLVLVMMTTVKTLFGVMMVVV